MAVAALGGCVAEEFESWQSLQRDNIPAATTRLPKRFPELTDIDALGGLPEGSLGNDLYRMLVDNNFDAEVLDREVIGLANLPPAYALR